MENLNDRRESVVKCGSNEFRAHRSHRIPSQEWCTFLKVLTRQLKYKNKDSKKCIALHLCIKYRNLSYTSAVCCYYRYRCGYKKFNNTDIEEYGIVTRKNSYGKLFRFQKKRKSLFKLTPNNQTLIQRSRCRYIIDIYYVCRSTVPYPVPGTVTTSLLPSAVKSV